MTRLLRFALPSAVGIFVFLTPVELGTKKTIVFAVFTDALQGWFAAQLPWVLFVLIATAALGALAYRGLTPVFRNNAYLHAAFAIHPVWIALRFLGLAVVVSVTFDVGPQWLRATDTGAMVLRDIGINALLIFVVGLLFLPLLTEYGLLEFVGAMLKRPFQTVFRLPGRAAVDVTTSIVAASSVGLLVTISQFERGHYSAREAAIIACGFSMVSIPFCVLISRIAQIEFLLFPWYGSVVVSCLACATVVARLPPLSRKKNDYFLDEPAQVTDANTGLLETALARADQGPGPVTYLKGVALSLSGMLFGVIPPTMGLATLVAAAVFHTPIFDVLSQPLAWLLETFDVAQAVHIAPGFITGFFDQFMPALIAQSIDSELWRFVLAGLAVTQVVFVTEFGVIVLRSSLPLTLLDLFWVFVQRTLVALPLLLLAGSLAVD